MNWQKPDWKGLIAGWVIGFGLYALWSSLSHPFNRTPKPWAKAS
jgi:hypothetical protein